MSILTLTLLDLGNDEIEVRVETDSDRAGSLAEQHMAEIVSMLEGKSDTQEYHTLH